ncbi:MAG: hypothetical protein A3F14_01460 [Gammaproteobacteria bacterium RIFCSPHIGHO2_12_FULL_43_28]|nr:MAG: hypothetical protein A3F14_01460 [Gammaproteobacteria bacterium RIFCSPHIGHO2_12_FULL_43_28]
MQKIFTILLGCSCMALTTLANALNTIPGSSLNSRQLQSLPKLRIGLDLGLLQPSNEGLNYAKNSDRAFIVAQKYNPYYGFDLKYLFPYKNSNLGVAYHHFYGSNSSNTSDPFTLRNGQAATWSAGRYSWKIDDVNLYAEHSVSFDNYFDINLIGGLEYTRLSRDVRIEGKNDSTTYPDLNLINRFAGIGPEFGFDGICHPFSKRSPLSVFGGLNYAILYGERESNADFGNLGSISENTIISHVTANFGIQYDYNKRLNINLGYQFQSYIGAIKDTDTERTYNQSFEGPYIRANYNFGY